MTKCMLTCISVEGHENPTQDEMYERYADAKITSNAIPNVLRPEFFKELMKVCIFL